MKGSTRPQRLEIQTATRNRSCDFSKWLVWLRATKKREP
ncbi:hypothetical protein L917_15440 [Phytophthora nicotianae]|uniref:Uncharacterized protein n=1 Tax=Phytophthora nicotianae TaxID=4792 RepID=W2KI78_PHYNI|nr:hypothetical protein L917_15440 [Phytophthora nicotianae]